MGTEKSTLAIEIGRRIAERRKQLGLTTQAQAAEKAGLTQQFFASVETGAKNIRAESIIKVSRALNISADFLLTGIVTDLDRHQVMKMLEPLDERQFLEIQNIIRDILKFGGCPPEI